ncbi:uncharacterized protein LOC129920126 [Episyrphus balteatus]|uniref:uncharacterized protein LOC129920126 n=1 Tax=Episyrphus balteatus TaxID=286459 RepID=UPI002484FEDE|nr:uncharacterized protein LOC129920126 [Episyrphus balteatus]
MTTGNYKIIHFINLTMFEEVISKINTDINHYIPKNSLFLPQIELQKTKIGNLLEQLQDKTHNREKRAINWIGSAWKWLAGNPDATDWDKIVFENNKLSTNNNRQYHINKYLTKVTDTLIDKYNKIIDKINTNITEKYEQIIFNKLSLLKEEIGEIVLAGQLAKRGIVNSNLLSKIEISDILSKMESLPFKNELQAIEYAEPMMLVKKSVLLYVICLPQTEDTTFNNIIVKPTVKNNKRIHLSFSNLFISEHLQFGIIGKCLEIEETILCKRSQLQKLNKDDCVLKLLNGEKVKCDFNYENRPIIELINESTLFLTNYVGNITYGRHFRNLNGSFLINFFNESIEIDNIKYSNWESKTYHILPPLLQNNLTEGEIKLDLQYLHKLHLDNVEKLSFISSNSKLFLTSNLTILLIGATINLILFIFLKKQSKNKKKLQLSSFEPLKLNIPVVDPNSQINSLEQITLKI